MKKLTPMGVLGNLCYILKRSSCSQQLKKMICATGFLLSAHAVYPQVPALKPLSIGDTMPDITVTNVYNYPSPTIRLSDLKGKLVILDFMTTSCPSCIKALPRLDSLQNQYADSLQIILVSPEDPARIQAFLKKRDNFSLPFVAEDSLLNQLFPHFFISHIGWIGTAGTVKAITYSEYVIEKNITAVIEGQNVHWPQKNDVAFNDYQPALLELNQTNIHSGSSPERIYYSSIVSYMPDVQKSIIKKTDSSKNTTQISMINYSIIELYLLLYERFRLPRNQILINLPDAGNLIYEERDDYFDSWKRKNFYCLEAIYPGTMSINLLQKKLIADLDFFLGLHTEFQKRKVECLVLRNNKSGTRPTKKPEGVRVGQVVYLLNKKYGAVPVINETVGTTFTTLPLTESQVTDNSFLRDVLKQNGFELKTEERELDFLVVSGL